MSSQTEPPTAEDVVLDGVTLATLQMRQGQRSYGERLACPYGDCCEKYDDHGSLSIRCRNGKAGVAAEGDDAYRCTHCGRTFDEPAVVEIEEGDG